MYARSTTIQAQPSSIDAGVAHVREAVLPRIQEVDGCVGLSLLVDRETGRCIATTAWETEDAMRASAEPTRPVRDRVAGEFGAVGSATVDDWEIAVLHRDHRAGEGACARAIWVKLPPDQLDAGIEFYKMSVLPDLEALDGFCSASLLVDRASGRAVTCTSFDSLDAMQRSREQATALKNTKILEVGAEELDDGEFELRLAHLRAPELV
ncbi:antibiotic biosynthesis monooxygenase [Mycobacterium sp.]|uniref:antibiotic biosynthesis monooxygenase n=1 Tax=Mycobacterium sp. TaxID=1785 RepID=UPI002C329359|nr:antibiotic biosynthesis monooxygenase [Mycobacterium sp.]HXB88740.1 antibiotic biosynthesis monooxygenase [Mycobacterium sp.]